MKSNNKLFFGFCLLTFYLVGISKAYSQVINLTFPKDNQVIQRDDNDEAIFKVSGKISDESQHLVTLSILKNGSPFYRQTTASSEFTFQPLLNAGKFDYTFILTIDENIEIKKVSHVAVGDVYLIYGQSNALGLGGIDTYRPAENPWMRFFSVANYENGDSQWVMPYRTSIWPGTGAMELQKFLCERYNYPVGVIVASVGGADIKSLNKRNDFNPTDINTDYGKLLLQTIFTGVKDQLKYIIFRHGETDANYQLESELYPIEFEKLYNNLVKDFPNLVKIFNGQINILTTSNKKAGFLRDYQRRTKYLFSKVTPFSTVGTQGYDGLHYNLNGYSQTAFELSRIIGREVYHDNLNEQIYSPDIKSVRWDGQKFILTFDESMEMRFPNDTTINNTRWSISDIIYIDGKNNLVRSGEAFQNKIFLYVNDTLNNFKKMSYLPNAYGNFGTNFYDGLHFKNKFGMRAFSFDEMDIIKESQGLSLNAKITTNNFVELNWTGDISKSYQIKRSEDNINFTNIAEVRSSTFVDNNTIFGKKYYYQVVLLENSEIKSNSYGINLNCLFDLSIERFPEVEYLESKTSILGIFTLLAFQKIDLRAQSYVNLEPGFDAKLGSDFNVDIGGCINN